MGEIIDFSAIKSGRVGGRRRAALVGEVNARELAPAGLLIMIRTNSRVRIFLLLPALALILAAFSAWGGGYLMLAIPSAAYEGYKYEHSGGSSSSSTANNSASASSKRHNSDSNTE
ncbi:MAG: hypothetical protein ACREQX_12715 [Candidatus Binataceae bacterium]